MVAYLSTCLPCTLALKADLLLDLILEAIPPAQVWSALTAFGLTKMPKKGHHSWACARIDIKGFICKLFTGVLSPIPDIPARLAWENSRHFATPPLAMVFRRSNVWGTNSEIPYWWRVLTKMLFKCFLFSERNATLAFNFNTILCGESPYTSIVRTAYRSGGGGGGEWRGDEGQAIGTRKVDWKLEIFMRLDCAVLKI